ncbi:MAG: HDOD domain-containing protein [Gammaproteobacteria bacterium]|nr:HDOD domain-containing protein [Gammaproteobacteria bacterium]
MEAAEAKQGGKLELVQMLAQDLAKGGLELPSFPDIVIRIRQALANENVTTEQIVQIIGADPVLAARILKISNSAALRPATDAITDLRTAVNRIGHSMVRNTSMSHGIAQSKSAYKLKEARVCMEKLWDECALVAALCFVLAKKRTKLNPDEAMLVGLMHGIGKLYILGRAESHPEIFGDEHDLFHVMDEWHGAIGSSILENWGFAPYMSEAVAHYREIEKEHGDQASYTDVLTLAWLFAQLIRAEDDMEFQLDKVPASRHLQITTGDMIPILQESQRQINSLHRALGK